MLKYAEHRTIRHMYKTRKQWGFLIKMSNAQLEVLKYFLKSYFKLCAKLGKKDFFAISKNVVDQTL